METHGHRETGAPRTLAKVLVKVQAKAKPKAKAGNEHLKHVCALERKDTRKEIVNSRVQRVQTAEMLLTCGLCVKTRKHKGD